MKHYLLSLLLLVPYLLAAQKSTRVLGLTLVYTNSSIPETANGTAKADQFFRSQVPESWGNIPINEDSYYLYQLSQSGFRLGMNLQLGSKKEDPRFAKQLDLGISFSDRNGASYYNYYDTLLATNVYATPLGTLYEDTVFTQRHHMYHYTGILAIDAHLRVYTSKEGWLKGYAGPKIQGGFTINSGIEAIESQGYRREIRLDDKPLFLSNPIDDYPYDTRHFLNNGPSYVLIRVGLPVGVESRFGKPGVDAGQLVLVLEGEIGTELTTGPMGFLSLYTGINLGIRYHL